MLDPAAVALAGIPVLFLIILVIEAAKKFFPSAPGKVWLGVSLVLGAAGQVVAYLIANGTPSTLEGWTSLVVLGLFVGLSASKTYDEAVYSPPPESVVLQPSMDLDGVELEFTEGEIGKLADQLAAKIGARFVPLPIPTDTEGEDIQGSSPFDGRAYTFLSDSSNGGDLGSD